ncbi:MAG: type IV toxin-antitoxin system AbiEi family antitoxin domain-containing protein [Nocardioidaceae bacterium]|nr:type IV toxin-antitoxin system AbiEi family antitoxin domain-containing protein [Nocardioidaceae bacterium]MCL2614559.1 type IV toxin-antitoxin system AbiEi family antitoxin domain-containing protein [Nocardioidaceae bacterium]
MNMKVRALAAGQHGLITRRQAVDCGMKPEQIDRLVRRGTWTIVRRGVYVETAIAEAAHSHRHKRILIDAAASLRIRGPHVWSHHSAAHLLDLAVLHEPHPITHVTRTGIVGSHDRRDIKHHRAPYPPSAVVGAAGISCLDAARTALDITREHGYLQGLVAADSALRSGSSLDDLRSARELMRSWPHSTVMDDVLASAHPDTDSVGETLTRVLVAELGFGVPQVQFGLAAGGRVAWCDLRLGRHTFEFDGELKYIPTDQGGFATTDPARVVWLEKQRQDFVCGFKIGMSWVVWSDLWGAQRAVTRDRLIREYLDTCRLFGTDISDLAQYRPRGERRRPGVRRLDAA